MPKIVDHKKQREKVAQAVWRVVLKHGIEKASVRNIAKEANLPVSTMRHYFSNQSELLLFTMEYILSRIEHRFLKFANQLDKDRISAFEAAKQLIKFFIHIFNQEEQSEMKVWLSFTAKALHDEKMKKLSRQMYMELYEIMEAVFEILKEGKILKSGLDTELEVQRLYALTDGLALHCVMRPDFMTKEKVDAIITRHLASLCDKQRMSRSEVGER